MTIICFAYADNLQHIRIIPYEEDVKKERQMVVFNFKDTDNYLRCSRTENSVHFSVTVSHIWHVRCWLTLTSVITNFRIVQVSKTPYFG